MSSYCSAYRTSYSSVIVNPVFGFFVLILLGLPSLTVAENRKADFVNEVQVFLNMLDADEREKVQLRLTDPNREQWHYYPDLIAREGLRLKEMTKNKQDAVFRVLETLLSSEGIRKTRDIILLEEILYTQSGWSVRNPEKYYIAIYGMPDADGLWALSFEGHHVSLNFLVDAGVVRAEAPRFFGANPATYRNADGGLVAVLKQEEAFARQLLSSFTREQKESAIFSTKAPSDILNENRSTAKFLDPKGIAYATLRPDQQNLFKNLVTVYLAALPEAKAQKRLSTIFGDKELELHFAWAGSETAGEPHYYRIQGKTFLIEYDNTQHGANHIHTVWRDISNDFGRDYLQEHYLQQHKHNSHQH